MLRNAKSIEGQPITESMTTRILVVADDLLTRAGLAALLADEPGCTVVGQVGDEVDADGFTVFDPEVIVWDLGWDPDPETDLERLRDASRESAVPIIVLLPDELYVEGVWSAGVRNILHREVDPASVAAAVRTVALGLTVLGPSLVPTTLFGSDRPPDPLIEDLTGRELEVLALLAEGLTNKAIAHRLEISEHTVKFHVNAILNKLNAQSRTEAAVRATRLGLDLL